jgi:signal transduction histidine kinase
MAKKIEIAVADTGEGIAPQDLPHVFERFWRAEKRLGSGTGLGLSVAQSLVEAQGGRIWVENTPGAGTTFQFTLPLVGHDV